MAQVPISRPINKTEWWVTAPSFCWMILFFLVPTLFIFAYTFHSSDLYGNIEGWTFSNWKELLRVDYIKVILRTIGFSLAATFCCLIIALPVGYCLARTNPKIKQLLLILFIIPFWSSFLVRIYSWKVFLHPESIFKKFLVFFHLISPSTSLLYNDWAVLLVMVYTYLPFAILPLYAAASKFDFNLIEAAQDLGSSKLQAFYKIFIPTISKGILTATIMVLIPSLGSYVIPELVGSTESQMIGNKIAQKVFLERNLPQAAVLSAFMALLVLLPLASFPLLQKLTSLSRRTRN